MTAAIYPTFAGLPLASWAFACRIWIAIVVALYAGFWLQLDAASSSAVTVAILATPTRGQALEKAGFRVIGTVIGVTVSIVLVGALVQTRDLILVAFAAWVGVCIYASALSDGNRSYAAVLSGYTVALIAIQQMDAPLQVFDAGVERGAAIAVGIAAVALVNDLLAAPERHPALTAQLTALHCRVREEAGAVLRREVGASASAAGLLSEIAGLRSEIETLSAESSSGPARTAAARSTAVALVAELHAVHVLANLPVVLEPALRDGVIEEMNESRQHNTAPRIAALDRNASGPMAASLAWAVRELLRRDREAGQALSALGSGVAPPRLWRTPFCRSYRIAAEAGVRAAVWLALTSVFFVLAGWPSADAALSLVAVVIGLGAVTANPRGFTMMALIAAPIAITVAGTLEFLVLDGVTEFPLLALGLAPVVIGLALLMLAKNGLVSALSRLNLIFVLAILAPSNPQTYDPQSFLFTSLFVCAAAGVLLAAQFLLPPITDEQRLGWLISSARREAGHLPSPTASHHAPEEAMFRDATRIAQIARAGLSGRQHDAILKEAVTLFGQAGLLRQCDAQISSLKDGPSAALVQRARDALTMRDIACFQRIASKLHDVAGDDVGAAAAALQAASLLLATSEP